MRNYALAGVTALAAALLYSMSLSPAAAPADGDATSERSPNPLAPRAVWTTSHVAGTPGAQAPYRTERAFPGLMFTTPVALTTAPGSNRLFLVELDGKIFSFPDDDRVPQPDLCLDLAAEVPGMTRAYGLTFHPNFEENHFAYVSYILTPEDPRGTRVSRFTVRDTNPPLFDPASEVVLVEWLSGGHNGGCMEFGPDGYLYITTGDGTSPSPPDIHDTGQDISDLLSSILRIDVDHPDANHPGGALPYSVPADNPFVDLVGARPEVWSYGFRNPWKMSFDPATGDLWVGDVGWELWELVYRVERGGNYGWSVMEGPQPVRPEARRGPTEILPPIVDHPHTEARSVTGGYVYHGERYPDLEGAYVYGDYVTGKIWGLRADANGVTWHELLANTPHAIITFAVDTAGELLVVDYAGTIHRLVPNDLSQSEQNPFPTTLSATGLFRSVADHTMADGVVPFSINSEMWADGATAERYLAVPSAEPLSVDRKGVVTYPEGTVLLKTLSLERESGRPASRKRIESQLLHFEGGFWRGYSYRWNEEGTDATLVDERGLDERLAIVDPDADGGTREQTWHFSARSECVSCHNFRAGGAISIDVAQLNREHDYGAVVENQLDAWIHAGLLGGPGTEPRPQPAPLVDAHDTSKSLDERVRSYLAANCAHCHRRGGGGTTPFEMLHTLGFEEMGILGVRPTQGAFGIAGAQIVAPGEPYRSVMYYRMAKIGSGRMPHLGSNVPDDDGIRLIHDWIAAMKPAAASNDEQLASLSEAALEREVASLASTDSPEVPSEGMAALFATPMKALATATLIADRRMHEPMSERVIEAGAAHSDPAIRDLFERFLPESRRTKRLGSVVDPAALLAVAGDVDRGRQVFFNNSNARCKSCHRIGAEGGTVGPDLSQIGKKYIRPALLETILEPSRAVAPEFVAYLVETSGGQVHTGLLVAKNHEEVVLRDIEDRRVVIPADEVELMVPQQKSLMPELLLRDMTAQDVADLLEYLGSLK